MLQGFLGKLYSFLLTNWKVYCLRVDPPVPPAQVGSNAKLTWPRGGGSLRKRVSQKPKIVMMNLIVALLSVSGLATAQYNPYQAPRRPSEYPSTDATLFITGNLLADPLVQGMSLQHSVNSMYRRLEIRPGASSSRVLGPGAVNIQPRYSQRSDVSARTNGQRLPLELWRLCAGGRFGILFQRHYWVPAGKPVGIHL